MVGEILYCPLLSRGGGKLLKCLEEECAWWVSLAAHDGCALKVAVELFEDYYGAVREHWERIEP